VMCPSAPFSAPEYQHARHWSKIMAELFKPQAPAVVDLWDGEEKVAGIEYWLKDIQATDPSLDVKAAMLKDTGNGVIINDAVEPLYGQQYLPKKFKIAVTVPGDNSIDIYINDVGLVVQTDEKGELLGFNVMVGGGMGRTHNKESTFARAADHLGFVSKEDCMELTKCIVAAQRDHGNREVRQNARMKYLVDGLGIDGFRTLVEGYFGKPIEPWRAMEQWQYQDWMGWHEQGDGNLFLGLNVEQGRIKDYGESEANYAEMGALKNVKMRSAVHKVVKDFQLTTVLSPSQSLFFKDVKPSDRPAIDAIMKAHGVKSIEVLLEYKCIKTHSLYTALVY
jgi:sulfite reductase (ferredoxin)